MGLSLIVYSVVKYLALLLQFLGELGMGPE